MSTLGVPCRPSDSGAAGQRPVRSATIIATRAGTGIDPHHWDFIYRCCVCTDFAKPFFSYAPLTWNGSGTMRSRTSRRIQTVTARLLLASGLTAAVTSPPASLARAYETLEF